MRGERHKDCLFGLVKKEFPSIPVIFPQIRRGYVVCSGGGNEYMVHEVPMRCSEVVM